MIVALYQYSYGDEVRVYRTREAALGWKNEIATDRWRETVPDHIQWPSDPIDAGDAYFEYHSERGDEFFSTYDCELIDV